MEPYLYSNGGPVTSYGWDIENSIEVGILEGLEIDKSTLDNIYDVFRRTGKQVGVDDVPVVFHYEELAQKYCSRIRDARKY
jgi:hypothetical protein